MRSLVETYQSTRLTMYPLPKKGNHTSKGRSQTYHTQVRTTARTLLLRRLLTANSGRTCKPRPVRGNTSRQHARRLGKEALTSNCAATTLRLLRPRPRWYSLAARHFRRLLPPRLRTLLLRLRRIGHPHQLLISHVLGMASGPLLPSLSEQRA